MKLRNHQFSTQPQIFKHYEHPWYKFLNKPKPPTQEEVDKAKFVDKTYEWTRIAIDTLLLSRLYHPNLLDIDKQHAWKHMPLQLYGRHSLESYGYRLGEYKGNFSQSTDWQDWSQEMEDYCVQDVNVTTKLWKHFLPYLNGSR